MHLIITDPWLAQKKALHVSGLQLAAVAAAAVVGLIVASLLTYHLLFIYGARQGWPVITQITHLISSGERNSQERYLKENLDAMARKLGEMQARMILLDSLGERISTLAGVPLPQNRPSKGAGGVLVLPEQLSMDGLRDSMVGFEQHADETSDWMTLIETRLFTDALKKHMLPTARPVEGSELGSAFGWRLDPLTGQRAMHTGLDFPADVGTPILAAAGGVVVAQEFHPAYGNVVEIDHGNQLVTRYAHSSRVHVRKGDVVKRGQLIAEVGSTGRSTGPHLHFEVWLAGVTLDPQKFLEAGNSQSVAAVTKITQPPSRKAGP